MLLDITTFFSHLHPLVVHLPIGLLLLAILFEFVSYNKRFHNLNSSVPFIFLLGFIAALVASVSGYLLSLSGEYDYQRLSNHKLSGFAVVVVSGVLFIMNTTSFKKMVKLDRKVITFLSVLLFVLVSYAGHQGGSLTHGSDYLSLQVLTRQKIEKPATVEDALLYEQVIQPILSHRCSQCHREDKSKGKLSMHTISELIKGGKSGPAVVAGNLEESELYRRITLDLSNEKFMPADGKPRLTKGETAIIKWWIERGLVQGKKISELDHTEEIKSEVAVYLGFDETNNSEQALRVSQSINAEIPASINFAILDSLQIKGVIVRIMLHNPVMLDVTLPSGSDVKVKSIGSNLSAIAKNVIWLNLSGNNLRDSDLDFLPGMTNLEKLRLEKNPLTDAIGDKLVELHHLEAVNLNETKITNKCLERLNQLPNLKRVYHWKTMAE